MTEEYWDLALRDVENLRRMRDNILAHLEKRQFKAALEGFRDLQAFHRHRKLHPSQFENFVQEIDAIAKGTFEDATIMIDFEAYCTRTATR